MRPEHPPPAGGTALRGAAEKSWGDICGARGGGPAGAEQRKEKIGKEKEGRRGFPWLRGGLGAAGARVLFVRPEEAGDFGAEEFDEGAGQHLLVFLRVLEVVLGVRQHVEESFDELLVLWGSQARGGGSPSHPVVILQRLRTEATSAGRAWGTPEGKDAPACQHPPEPRAARTPWGHAHLEDLLVVFGGVEPAVPHDVLHQLLVVLCNAQPKNTIRA